MNYEYKLKDYFFMKEGDVSFWIEQDSSIHTKIVEHSNQLKVDPEELTSNIARIIGEKLVEMADKIEQVVEKKNPDLQFNECIDVNGFDAQIYFDEEQNICVKIFCDACHRLCKVGSPVRLTSKEARLIGKKLAEMADKIDKFDEACERENKTND
ncbi:MAG: hypothetical protein ABIH77_02145 [Pseudomonadota bacterium]|nr:hypothetical protein [Gammaproteobacteria bacterium]MBU1559184.1 hypothetical protein [Gammaproteobacteria bacterium]MBU1926897.1 hypothetical protein [Gammaproteobacteria bacterium]MBU2546040.1 hypothetical protein [Gammaproteobacteria bacterium]